MNEKKIITLDNWADEFSREVTAEIYKVLDGVEKDKQGKLHQKLPIAFLARFLAITVFNSLKERPSHIKTNKQQYEYTLNSFNEIKAGVQDAVAQAFSGAMSEYSGKDLDYLCTIKMLAPPQSKLVC